MGTLAITSALHILRNLIFKFAPFMVQAQNSAALALTRPACGKRPLVLRWHVQLLLGLMKNAFLPS